MDYPVLPPRMFAAGKEPIRERLFGSLKSVSIELAVDLLKIRKVKDHDTRLKIACLAITSSILLSSSHTPRIIPDYGYKMEMTVYGDYENFKGLEEEEEKWVEIFRVKVDRSGPGFQPVNSPFKLIGTRDTQVRLINPPVNDRLCNTYVVDTMGVVFNTEARFDLATPMMVFYIRDNIHSQIKCVATGEQAYAFWDGLEKMGRGQVIVALKMWRIRKHWNCSGPDDLSLETEGGISDFRFNPRLSEVEHFRQSLLNSDPYVKKYGVESLVSMIQHPRSQFDDSEEEQGGRSREDESTRRFDDDRALDYGLVGIERRGGERRIENDSININLFIKSVRALYSYPSGRVSFHFLVTNIISKDEVSLAQSSVALKGQVDSIQQEVTLNEPVVLVNSDSDCDMEEIGLNDGEDNDSVKEKPPLEENLKSSLRMLGKLTVEVKSILDDLKENWAQTVDFSYDDELEDALVDDMIKAGEKNKDKETKDKLEKEHMSEFTECDSSELPHPPGLANHICTLMKDYIGGIEGRVASSVQLSVHHGLLELQKMLRPRLKKRTMIGHNENSPSSGGRSPPLVSSNAQANWTSPARDIIDGVLDDLNLDTGAEASGSHVSMPEKKTGNQDVQNLASHDSLLEKSAGHTDPHNNGDHPNPMSDQLDTEMHIPYNLLGILSFSLGLLHKEVTEVLVNVKHVNFVMHEDNGDGGLVEPRKRYNINPNIGQLFSDLQEELRQKKLTLSIYFQLIDISPTHTITPTEFSDIALRPQHISPKVMDALMLFLARELPDDDSRVQILDTTFHAYMVMQHFRVVKTAVKDRPKLKFAVTSVVILDSNVAFKSESLIKKDLNPIAALMPYIVKAANGTEFVGSLKPFSLNQAKGVPQIVNAGDAAVMFELLIEAHTKCGLPGLKCITTHILPKAAKQLVVIFFNDLIFFLAETFPSPFPAVERSFRSLSQLHRILPQYDQHRTSKLLGHVSPILM
ncbi:hypothetical protein IGI04_002541 [Brassica rapa subsp. trilocularis]|uniref:C2 domain-containing protein n=1 Tax=Brassica rapa subsp. trilocularis TaxID=1813537 RepID=A0ABQ7NZ50_BRACM|nr:hypothetical protein IGI04_002541 [Brassica rapa subsp. trilocularis]